MKQRGVFLIGFLLVTVYFFLFPRTSGRELIITPDYLTDLVIDDSSDNMVSTSPPALFVRNGAVAGYLNSDHRLLMSFTSERMAVDKNWIAVSGDNGLSLMEPNGRLITRIPDISFPVARNGNLFLYGNNTGILSKINPINGRILWHKEYISTITVLDGCPGKTLVGLLDGRVELIDDSGTVILKYRPGGSRVEAIYGGTLSRDGSKIALISGLDPQRFVLLEGRKNGYRPVSHHDTGTDFRRSVSIFFARDDEQLLYENNGFVEVVSLGEDDIHSLDLSGKLVGSIDNLLEDTLLLFGRDDSGTSINMFTRNDLTIFKSQLPFNSVEIVRDRNYAVIVIGNRIAVLEFSVR